MSFQFEEGLGANSEEHRVTNAALLFMENVSNDCSEFSDRLTQHMKLQDNTVHLQKSSGLVWDNLKNTLEWMSFLYRFNQSLYTSKEKIQVDVSEKIAVY